jgi:3-hydroxyacyl-[acyl-carrier-protein] dehydratase
MNQEYSDSTSLTGDEISQLLDITPPFLMIDEIKKIDPGSSAYSVKRLDEDEWFFKCHLHQELVMPGTLQIEAMLQTLVLTLYTMEGHKKKTSYITNIKTKLISKVSPGAPLCIHANLISFKRGIAKGVAVGKINDKTVCQGEFTFISPHEISTPK